MTFAHVLMLSVFSVDFRLAPLKLLGLKLSEAFRAPLVTRNDPLKHIGVLRSGIMRQSARSI